MELELIARKDRRIAKAIAEVLRDLTVRPTRVEVAHAASLAPTYFSKRFRRIVGKSYTRWNMCMRIDFACELLTMTDRRVQQIARAVGYEDVTTFERAFRKVTGMCPTECRALRRAQTTPNAEGNTQNAETRAKAVK